MFRTAQALLIALVAQHRGVGNALLTQSWPTDLRHLLTLRETTGMGLDANPLKLMRTLRQRKRGALDFAEFGKRVPFKVMKDASVAYLGYAVKT